MAKNILHSLEQGMEGFSKGQKRIAAYMLENYDKAAFMTASRLGKLVGVSESTVVRFASELGYDGYPSMQRALQDMIRSRLTSTQRIQAAGDMYQDVLPAVVHSDIEKLRQMISQASQSEFDRVVDNTVKFARDRGAGIIAITDNELSPVYQLSDAALLVPCEMISFVDSMVAPLSLINALLVALSNRFGANVSATFAELEDIWNEYGVFGKMDDE